MNMQSNHQFSVSYSFDLRSTWDVFAQDNHCLADVLHHPDESRDARALVYVDSGLVAADPDLCARISAWFQAHHEYKIHLAAMPELIDGGEALKNDMSIVDRVGQACLANKICRHSYIISIGGGAVLDAVGFAASIIHRGIRHIRLPSTVLAQNDAGLGVKNGINRFGNKNFYGCFAPPWAIINDSKFLTYLSDRSWRSGIAEAFKVSIIKDKEYASWLITNAQRLAQRDMPCMETLIERSAQLHLEHICMSGDPFEQGSSRPLDFGHWSAHRLEIISKHELNHGEAVAIGIALDLCYASLIKRIPSDTVSLILDALHQCGFTLWHNALELDNPPGRRSVLQGIEQFREHLGGELTIAMPDGLGNQKDIYEFDEAIFEQALAMLKLQHARLSQKQYLQI